MDSDRPILIPLDEPEPLDETIVGGKAAKLARLAQAGFRVPGGCPIVCAGRENFLISAVLVN